MNNQDTDIFILKNHVARLSEHFDTVQIFATKTSSEGTINCNWGAGDWFARYGQAKKWLIELFIDGSQEEEDEESENQERINIVSSHLAQIAEHFNNVQIFCSKTEDNSTYWSQQGSGNIFSRYGLIDIWLMSEANLREN